MVSKHPLEANLAGYSLEKVPKYFFLNSNLVGINLAHNYMQVRRDRCNLCNYDNIVWCNYDVMVETYKTLLLSSYWVGQLSTHWTENCNMYVGQHLLRSPKYEISEFDIYSVINDTSKTELYDAGNIYVCCITA